MKKFCRNVVNKGVSLFIEKISWQNLKTVVEGRSEGTRERGRSRKGMLDLVMNKIAQLKKKAQSNIVVTA